MRHDIIILCCSLHVLRNLTFACFSLMFMSSCENGVHYGILSFALKTLKYGNFKKFHD